MEVKRNTKEEMLAILRGSNVQQAQERYAYYSKKVFSGEIDFQEEQVVDKFYDFIDNNYDTPVDDSEKTAIAENNNLIYVDDDGLEAISLLKEYNPVRYVTLGKRNELFDWAKIMSDYRKERYAEIKKLNEQESVAESYLNEFIHLIKTPYYFVEAPSETYFSKQPLIIETKHAAIFHEYMTERLFTNDELDILVQNYINDTDTEDRMSQEIRQWLDINLDNRKWLLENRTDQLLFNESVLNFVEDLDTLEEIVG